MSVEEYHRSQPHYLPSPVRSAPKLQSLLIRGRLGHGRNSTCSFFIQINGFAEIYTNPGIIFLRQSINPVIHLCRCLGNGSHLRYGKCQLVNHRRVTRDGSRRILQVKILIRYFFIDFIVVYVDQVYQRIFSCKTGWRQSFSTNNRDNRTLA